MRTLILIVSSAAVAALSSTVSAQDFATPRDAATPARPVFFRAGGFFESTELPLEVSSITTQGTPGPDTKADANLQMRYDVMHQWSGVNLGVLVMPPTVRGLEFGLDLMLGNIGTTLTNHVFEGSIFNPNPGDGALDLTAQDEGEFAYGFALHGGMVIQERAFVGLVYEFLMGQANLNNQTFWNDVMDGDYEFTRHRLMIRGGVQVQQFRPFIALGFLVYEGAIDVHEATDPTNPDTWTADFEPEAAFRFAFGVEFGDRQFGGRVEIMLLADAGFGVSVFVLV